MRHRPLKRLLRAHREADDGTEMRDAELGGQQPARGFDVVANRDRGKGRAIKRRRRVARRRGEAVGEHLGRHDEMRRWIERPAGADQEIVAVMVRPVPGRNQDRVVARGVERPERRIGDAGVRQHDAALETKVAEREKAPVLIRRGRRHLRADDHAHTGEREAGREHVRDRHGKQGPLCLRVRALATGGHNPRQPAPLRDERRDLSKKRWAQLMEPSASARSATA